jgi:hypothetical protein
MKATHPPSGLGGRWRGQTAPSTSLAGSRCRSASLPPPFPTPVSPPGSPAWISGRSSWSMTAPPSCPSPTSPGRSKPSRPLEAASRSTGPAADRPNPRASRHPTMANRPPGATGCGRQCPTPGSRWCRSPIVPASTTWSWARCPPWAARRRRRRGGRILAELDGVTIPEEEVSRAATTVTRAWQYTRWIDGHQHAWVGRRRGPANDSGDSGLRFDTLEPPSQL